MKRKKLYIMSASLITASVIYTFASFNNPTDQEQKQSVFSNALYTNVNSLHAVDSSDFDLASYDDQNSLTSPSNITDNSITISSLPEGDVSKEVSSKKTTKTDTKDSEKETKHTKKKNKKTKTDKLVTTLSISDKSCEKEDLAISIADSYVNIRKKASTDSEIVGKLYKDNAAVVLKEKNDWLYISSGNVKGYVKAEYIKTGLSEKELNQYGTLVATVTTDGLNVRKKASTDSKRVDVVYLGESYPVLKQKENWVKIDVKDDHVKGYVKNEFINLEMSFSEAISIEEELALKKAQEETKSTTSISSVGSKPATVKGANTNSTSDEVKLLACLVHAEAGNQSYEGKLAVANVVLNRVKSSKYPNSIQKVIYQRGQFSVAFSGSLQKQLNHYGNYTSSSQKLSIQAAKDALAGNNNIGNRLYFNRYSKSLANSHSSGVKLQDHLFW